jgi:hypothetical protein
MGIKHFENYLSERKHLHPLSLSVLSESRLGIDASYYIQLLLENEPSREPLLAATGGVPLALTQRIETDLRVLEKLHIKPVFVFPGLPTNKKRLPQNDQNREQQVQNDACKHRRDAWQKYENDQEDEASKLWEKSNSVLHWDLWRMVLRIFRHRNVEFLVAPYLASAQLIYLQRHNKGYIHSFFGPTDALLYPGVDKLITSLDLVSPSPTFSYVVKKNIIADLGVSEDQFLDIGILVGFADHPSFPVTYHEQALKATVDMVKFYKTGALAVMAFADHPTVRSLQFQDHFARTRCTIKYSLILASDGTVTPLPLAITPPTRGSPAHPPHHAGNNEVPSDLHEIFTHRLPDEVYYYLSRGLLGPQALGWLTSGQIVETPPLDNGETNEYKRFVKEVITDGQTGPRATALALISSVCNQFWSTKKVYTQFWFDPPQPQNGRALQHNSPQTVQLAERVASWHVPSLIVEEELRRQNSATIDFALCLGTTASERLAQRTKARGNSPAHVLEKKDEVVANVIWRFLELRGFLLNSHTHSSLARAMYTSIRTARLNDKFQDPLYLFLELVRAGVMHGHLWSGRAFSGGPSFGTDEEKSSMLLVMRVLSIVPLNFKAQPWSAPISRELLVFNSFVRSLTRALRTLLEVTTLNMFLRSDAKRTREDLLDITLSLPFQTEVNTGFGVLAKVYLDALTHFNNGARVRDANAEGVREAKAMALDLCEETFSGVKQPKAEVERGFRFWDVALAAMRTLHAEGAVLRELVDQFEAAESWLAPMRP